MLPADLTPSVANCRHGTLRAGNIGFEVEDVKLGSAQENLMVATICMKVTSLLYFSQGRQSLKA